MSGGEGVSVSGGGITYAIGDVHGRLDLLLKAADAIQADLAGRSGHIVMLGDYVDRGPDSRGVIEFLMNAEKTGACTCLKGNHEDMMVAALRDPTWVGFWVGNGGGATLASYPEGAVPDEHVSWLSDLPTVAKLGNRIFVHAGLFPGVALEDQDEEAVLWIRDRFLLAEKDFAGWPHIVHGHTPVHPWKKADEPELLSWRTNLDTGAYRTGVLTVGVFEGDEGPPLRVLRVTSGSVETIEVITPGPAASTTADSGNEQVTAQVSQPIREDQIPLLRPSKGG